MIGGKLHNERSGIAGEHLGLFEHDARADDSRHADEVSGGRYQSGAAEERACDHGDERYLSAAGDECCCHYGHTAVALIFNGTRSHDSGNAAAGADKHRDEGFAGETELAEYTVKNECDTGQHLKQRNIEILDLGTYTEEPVDYPNYGKLCGEAVMAGKADRGIVLCGTGIGVSIAANKVKGIRCALCTSIEMARLSREHNNANVLAMGGRLMEPVLGLQITDVWIDTEFAGGRHKIRTDMLDKM